MTFRQYIALMAVATICCGAAWVLLLLNVDPFYASASGFAFFYVGLFLLLFGILSMALCWFFSLRSDLPLFRLVEKSFRASAGAASAIIGIVLLQGLGLIRLWALGILALGIACVAAFLHLAKRSSAPRREGHTT